MFSCVQNRESNVVIRKGGNWGYRKGGWLGQQPWPLNIHLQVFTTVTIILISIIKILRSSGDLHNLFIW